MDQLRVECRKLAQKGPVILIGAFNAHEERRTGRTDMDGEVGRFVRKMGLQDMGAPREPPHWPAVQGHEVSRSDTVYADPKWVQL